MAAIVADASGYAKSATKEVAFESGRVVVLPSPVDARGPLAEYGVVISPPAPLTLHVSASLVNGGKRSAWRISSITIASAPEEGTSYGHVRVSMAHLVIADVATLYCAGNGAIWNRPQEAMRAVRACSLSRRTGGRFVTDWGESAVALRVGRGPIRGRATITGDRVRIDVLKPESEPSDVHP